MRIGFTGVHGAGKTSLLKGMLGWPELDGHAFIAGLTRAQAKKGVSINENGDFESQMTLTGNLAWHLRTLPNVVTDRTLLDIYAYTLYLFHEGKLDSKQLNRARAQTRATQHLYDVVFYIRPEFIPEPDGVRSDNPTFSFRVATFMERLVTSEKLGTREIVVITGSLDDRLRQVYDRLKK